MKVLLLALVILPSFLSVPTSSSLDHVSIVFESYVKINDPWKLKINSIGISPINYVRLTRSSSKVLVEYCRKYPKQRRTCNNKNDPRFSIKETPSYFVSFEILLKNVETQDSAPYSLLIDHGASVEDTKQFSVYILQKPEIIHLNSISGTSMYDGSKMNIVCRINCGLPSGIYNLEIFNSATKRWVDFRTSDDIVIRPEKFKPAIKERKIQNEYFVREFTQVRCRVTNEVGTAEKKLTLKVKGKLDNLGPGGPLIVACSVPNPPLPKGSELICTHSKNTSWPPIHIGDEGYKRNVGLYTTLLSGTKTKYNDLDEGTYTCSVDNGAVKLCTRKIIGDFKDIPKVKIMSRVPTHKNQAFIFLCVIPSVFKQKAFTLRGKLQSGSWVKEEDRSYTLKNKPSNTFKFAVGEECNDMLVTCQLTSNADVKTSQVNVPIFCQLPGTLRFDPPRFDEPVPLMSKLKAVGLQDPEKTLTYVWDRIPDVYQIYDDPGPNLKAEYNVITIPTDYKYRGVKYTYQCFAYKRIGGKSYSSNVIEISFHTAMCSFKPQMDVLFGIYTNMNPHCSLHDARYNVEETWFELFYKPFISDMLLSLPISANYTRFWIFPTTDSKKRAPELSKMRSFGIKFNESHMGREHLEKLFRNNIYRLNATSPHMTTAQSCEVNSFEMAEDRLSEFRPNVKRIFLYSLDLYEHHVRKKFLFSSIDKDAHSYVMKSLSKDLLSEADRYFSNLLYLFNEISHTVDEIWFHYGSYCPDRSCPHLTFAKILGVHFSFTLVPQTSPMFEYGFERQWFPSKKYTFRDPKSMKCFIRTSMPGLRIQRLPAFKRICRATDSRMDPNIIEVYSVMANNCIWNSNQLAICRAMLGKPAGKLTISFLVSSDWEDASAKLEKESPPELNGNTFVRATAQIFVPKDRTSLVVRCKVVNKWNEDEKSVTYRCSKPKPSDPVIQIKPSVITEDENATIICYTKNWFVGKLCLETGWGKIIQCKTTESDASTTGKLIIVYKIPQVKENMDGQRYICSAQNYPLNKTENATKIFHVDRAKIRDTKVDIISGPNFHDKKELTKNILIGYWFTVRCSSLVGSIDKMGSTLKILRYRKDHLDVSFINSAKGCSKDPSSAFPAIIFTCKNSRRYRGSSDLMAINVTIKSAKMIQNKDVYMCVARNTISKTAKNVTTYVLAKPNIIHFSYSKLDNTILLYCDVSCVPRPEVKIKIIEKSRDIEHGTTIPLTEIRPGVCRLRFFFDIPADSTLLAKVRCIDTADFLNKKVTVTKDVVVFIKPAIFPAPVIIPDPAQHHKPVTFDCKFSALHLKLASSVLLFKKVAVVDSKINLPCMVYKKKYETVTGIWNKREASVSVNGAHIIFKLKSALVKDAGSYRCQAFYDTGESAWTMHSSLSKVLRRPRVNGIYFYGDGSGDHQVQKEKTKVLLGCQVNVGNKKDALNSKVDFKARGATIRGLTTNTVTLKDDTKVKTFYVIKPSISYTFHNASFSCSASDEVGLSSDTSRDLYVRYYPIHQAIKPDKTKIKVGEYLTCSADGYPEVTYLWFWTVNKARVTSVGPQLAASKLPRGSVEVVCSAQNDGKPSISFKSKNVIVDDGHVFLMFSQPTQPVLGKRLSLECPFFTNEPSAVIDWFHKEGNQHVSIAEWTPHTFRLAPSLERRNISVKMGDKGLQLVFSKARLEDSGSYRCRYQDATASHFSAMSGIDAKSSSELCVRSAPKCQVEMVPFKQCYAENDTVTLKTEMKAELDGCDTDEGPRERYFVILMKPKQTSVESRAHLFSSSGHVRAGGRYKVNIAMNAELDHQRLFCAVVDLESAGGEEKAVVPFETTTARVDLCVRHAVRNAIISHLAKNGSRAPQIRCAAAGNPRPLVELTAWGPNGWNGSARGVQTVQLAVPRGTQGQVSVDCVATNNLAGKEYVFYSAKTIQVGTLLAANKKMTTKMTTIIVLTVGAVFLVVGMGVFIYWKIEKARLAQSTSCLLPEAIDNESGDSGE